VYSWAQAAVTLFGLVIAALMLVTGMGWPALLLVAVLGAMTLRDPTGMPAWTRVGLGLRYLATGWLGSRQWEAHDDASVPRWLGGVEATGCELPTGVMGVVEDRSRYLAAMRVSPTRDPWLQSTADRDVTADDWARVVTSIPIETIDRLQVLTVTRSGGGDDLIADAATAVGPGLEVLKEVALHLAAHVRHTETVLIVRLGRAATKDGERRGGIQAVGQTLHSVLQHLGAQLPPEQVKAEILAPADWTVLFKTVLDIDSDDAARLPAPRQVDERWNTVTIDKTIHRTMWMWQWPQRSMAAGFLAPILTGPGNRVVSILVAPAETEPHQRSLDWAYRRATAAVETAKSSRHRKEAELDSIDRQLRELNEGHVPIHVLATVAVAGSSVDEVENLSGLVRSNAAAGSCRIAPLGGSQTRGLSWTLPLCRGLDKGIDG
jgi:hypothetical protein